MRTEEVEREAGSRDEDGNWVEPSFFCFAFFLCFCSREEEGEGQVWLLLLLLLRKQQTTTTTTTKGVIVYMYCIVCTIIHIHLLFSVWPDAAIEVNLFFFLSFWLRGRGEEYSYDTVGFVIDWCRYREKE